MVGTLYPVLYPVLLVGSSLRSVLYHLPQRVPVGIQARLTQSAFSVLAHTQTGDHYTTGMSHFNGSLALHTLPSHAPVNWLRHQAVKFKFRKRATLRWRHFTTHRPKGDARHLLLRSPRILRRWARGAHLPSAPQQLRQRGPAKHHTAAGFDLRVCYRVLFSLSHRA